MAKKKGKLFDYLNSIFYKKNIDYDKKEANSYILSLWLAQEKDLINIVNRANKYLFLLSDEAIYHYYWHKIPRGSRFIKWTKKEDMGSEQKEVVKGLMEKYNISEREARESII